VRLGSTINTFHRRVTLCSGCDKIGANVFKENRNSAGGLKLEQSYISLWEHWNKSNLHKWDHYIPIYEELFGGYTSKSGGPAILEIGVQRGGSCQLHKARFPGGRIVGLDIDPDSKLDSDVGFLIIGDQADPDVLKTVRSHGPFDIIIDDGGHTPDQQLTSFWGLWKSLNFGGIYVVEDVFANSIPGYTDSRYGINFMDFSRGLADKMSSWVMDKAGFRQMSADWGGVLNLITISKIGLFLKYHLSNSITDLLRLRKTRFSLQSTVFVELFRSFWYLGLRT